MELCMERKMNSRDITMAILWGSTVPKCNVLSDQLTPILNPATLTGAAMQLLSIFS